MNRVLDNILIAIATTGVLLSIKHFIGSQTVLYSGILIGVGLLILLFGERILDGQPNPIKSFFIKTLGLLFFIGGASFMMEHFNATLWWAYGLVGIALFNFHHLISERL
jgi:hypothetical protein